MNWPPLRSQHKLHQIYHFRLTLAIDEVCCFTSRAPSTQTIYPSYSTSATITNASKMFLIIYFIRTRGNTSIIYGAYTN